MKKIIILVALAAAALVASPATAKEGFYLGAFVPFNSISDDPLLSIDDGNGLGFRGGIGCNKYLALEASVFKTKHDVNGGGDVDLSGGTFDLKLDFPLTGSKIEPYLLIGVGRYELKGSSFDYKGDGSQIGFGLDMYLFPELNFNAGLTWRRIFFDSGKTAATGHRAIDVRTFDIGLTYHFL